MKYPRTLMAYFPIIFLLWPPKLSAQRQADQPRHPIVTSAKTEKTISGDVYFRLGPSGMPVYPRGAGNNEHWETGINLKLGYKKTQFYFSPMIAGAATFDNPDRFQFLLGGSYELPKRFSLQAILMDAYALNHIPPVDPKARRPTSSVNSFWLGGGWNFKIYQNQTLIFARFGLKSSEPVFYTYFTRPYASWDFGAVSESRLAEKTRLILKPEIYVSNHIRMARIMVDLGIEQSLGGIVLGGYYTMYRNLGIPEGIVDYRGLPLRKTAERLFFGIRVPFNSR